MRWIRKIETEARRRRPRPAARALLVTGLSVAVGCGAPDGPRFDGAGAEAPVRGGTFQFHHESNVRGLDPFISFDELSNMAIRLVFDGLLDYDENAQLIPSLAEALPDISEDGKTFRFRLRSGVKFHNGRELVAADVRWSMEKMLSPEVGSPGYTFYTNIAGLEAYRDGEAQHIQGIRVLDRRTIEFTLKEPDQTFLNAMAMTFAYPVPRENFERRGDAVRFHPVGTGPFRLVAWERGVRLIFERFDSYWRPGQPYTDRMIFYENLTRGVAVRRFRNGDIDAVHRFAPADYIFFKQAPKWTPYTTEDATVDITGIAMNCELEPFTNVHVRRAVALGVDRARWSRSRNNRLRVTGQPIPPGLLGYDENLPGLQQFDLDAAREEMRLAGHPNGLSEPVTLWVGEGDSSRFYGELAQSDLKKIGITVQLKPVAFAVYLQETGKPRTAQMLLTGWNQDFPDPADFLDILFHSRAIHDHDSENKAFYRNPALDDLLDRARVERDRDRRHRMYREANEIVTRDAPWAFMFNNLRFEAWQPYVKNYTPNPVYSQDYRYVWLDLPRRRIARRYENPAARIAALFPAGGRP